MSVRSGKATFGRHESFPLRFGWIAKGLAAIRDRPTALSHDDATVALGVGKNMVLSIRHWLQAARLVRPCEKGPGLQASEIAELVFGEHADPYLEDDATIWLLHWLLAMNPTGSTAIYWFFNHFHKLTFSNEEVASALRDFANDKVAPKTSVATLKRDAALVLRMYTRSQRGDRLALEDSLDSPLAMLDLIVRVDGHTWRSAPATRKEIPTPVLGFAVAELFCCMNREQLPVQDLMYSTMAHCAPGAVFRMTEEGLVNKLEALCVAHPDTLFLDRTAGVFQLYKRGPLTPLAILRDAYPRPQGNLAA